MDEDEQYLLNLDKERLKITPHDVYKLHCGIEGCNRFARVWDFGISPKYYWGRFGWQDLTVVILLCGKHWQYKKRGHEDRLIKKEGAAIEHLVFDKSVM